MVLSPIAAVFAATGFNFKCVFMCICVCVCPTGKATISRLQMRPDISLSAPTRNNNTPTKFYKGAGTGEQHAAGHQPPLVTCGRRPRGPRRLTPARGKEREIEKGKKYHKDSGTTSKLQQGQTYLLICRQILHFITLQNVKAETGQFFNSKFKNLKQKYNEVKAF